MAERSNTGTIRKIAVAFDPACAPSELLETAQEFAVFFGAELEALLVDDPDIARLSMLPFGRIFEPLSGTAVKFDRAAARSRRAGPTARARAAMRRLSESHRLNCTIQELSGLPLTDALTRSDAELLIIASFHGKFGARATDPEAIQIATEASGSVFLVSQLPVKTQRIFVVMDESDLGGRASDIAKQIANRDVYRDATLVRHLILDDHGIEAVSPNILSFAPTLVVVGVNDASIVNALHEEFAHDAFSVLTVR